MKTHQFLKALFFLVALCSYTVYAQTHTPMQLENLRWKKRVLMLFSPTIDAAHFVNQKNIISKNTQGIAERHLEVLELVPSGNAAGMREKLLRDFAVAPDAYTLILLGKDGQEKFRSEKPVPMEEIFKIIDQMPMRRQEMRKQE